MAELWGDQVIPIYGVYRALVPPAFHPNSATDCSYTEDECQSTSHSSGTPDVVVPGFLEAVDIAPVPVVDEFGWEVTVGREPDTFPIKCSLDVLLFVSREMTIEGDVGRIRWKFSEGRLVLERLRVRGAARIGEEGTRQH